MGLGVAGVGVPYGPVEEDALAPGHRAPRGDGLGVLGPRVR